MYNTSYLKGVKPINKPPNHIKRPVMSDKSIEQEIWRRIVVKVISWSDGLKNGGIIKKTDTITLKEWQFYCSQTLKININRGKEEVRDSLEATRKVIESFGGFGN